MKSLLRIVIFVFRCRHRQMGRVYTIKGDERANYSEVERCGFESKLRRMTSDQESSVFCLLQAVARAVRFWTVEPTTSKVLTLGAPSRNLSRIFNTLG